MRLYVHDVVGYAQDNLRFFLNKSSRIQDLMP